MISSALVGYILKAAIRDRLLISMLILIILSVSLSVFFGSAAIYEKAHFTAVFSASTLRIINVIALSLFTVFFIRRSFESRDIEYMLTRPIGRIKFLLSYAFGFSIIAIFASVLTAACVYFIGDQAGNDGFWLWALSIMMENIIMINAALFFSMILTSAATAAFTVFGYYVLSRMSGQVLGIIDSGKALMSEKTETTTIMELTMQLVSFLMPRGDLLGQSSWLLYGVQDTVGYGFVLAQGLIYTSILIIAALIDLVTRKF